MAKKSKPKPPSTPKAVAAQPMPTATAAENSAEGGASIEQAIAEVLRYPTLGMASVFLAVTLISLWAAYRYRNDLTMGVLAEPTSIILWIGLTVTLFASYWRQRSRQQKPPP